MPTSTLSKGIVQGWSPGETGWGDFMNANLKRINALLHEQWAQNIDTTSGLTYGYKGGVYASAGGLITVSDGTLALTANATNYVYRSGSVIAKSTTGFATDVLPMAVVVTDVSNILSVTDVRLVSQLTAGGLLALTGGLSLAGALQLADSSAIIKLADHLSIRDPADSFNAVVFGPTGQLNINGSLISGGAVVAAGGGTFAGPVTTGGLDATELSTGIVPTARVAGSYGGITQVGTLTSLAVTGRAYSGRASIGTSGASKSIDWTTANTQALSVTANCAISFLNAAIGQQLLLELSAASVFTMSWPGTVRWEDGIAPVLTGGGKIDLFAFYYNGTSFLGKAVGQGF